MNYAEVQNQVLMLLNQYSIAGAEVADTYNNQKDYITRMPGFVNDAMMEIATSVRKIEESVLLDDLPHSETGNKIKYVLPQDFYQLKSGDTIKTEDGRTMHTNEYELIGNKFILIPKRTKGEYRLFYYRYPHLVDQLHPDVSEELDNDIDTHRAIPYYVAAMLVSHDDAFLCSLFQNQFADRLSLLGSPISMEVHPTTDAYNFY